MRTNTKRGMLLVIATITAVVGCALCACDDVGNAGDTAPFVYERTESGYTVTSIKDTGAKEIIVPETYLGVAVTGIADGAFAGCTNATTAVIPDSVKSIGKGAFRGCRSLNGMTIPFTGQSPSARDEKAVFGYIFGQADYAGGAEIEQKFGEFEEDRDTYYIPSALCEVKFTGESVPYGAFSGCNMISTFVVGSGVTEIDDDAFLGNNLAYVYCESNAVASLMLGDEALGGLLSNIPAVCLNKNLNRLSGYVESMDVKSDWTYNGNAYDMYANVKYYRFEAEQAELAGGLSTATGDVGSNGVPTGGGAYVTGFYPNGGAGGCYMEFKIHASKAAKVKFIYCCAARSTHFFNSCYRLTLNGDVVVPENNVDLSLPKGVNYTASQWTRFEIMEFDFVEGENVFNMHFTPNGQETAEAYSNDMNVDYIEFLTDAVLTWAI